MVKNTAANTYFLVLFAGVSILLYLVLAPFLTVLALAGVLAVLLHTHHERLTREFRGHTSLAAALTVGLTLIFVIVPLFFIGWEIFQEAQSLYFSVYGTGGQYLNSIQTAIEVPIQHVVPSFVFNVNAYASSALAFIASHLGTLVYQTIFVVFDTFLLLLALFFFLRDGRGLVGAVERMSPLGDEVTREILAQMYATIRAVVSGTVLTALLRFVCIAVAFYLCGIPNALLWGSVGGIIGAIPGLGTPFAFIGATGYALVVGNWPGVIGLVASAIAISALIDNLLTSYFFSRGLAVSPVFVLFSILGGIVFFGPLGFILGPLVLSVFLSIVRVYQSAP